MGCGSSKTFVNHSKKDWRVGVSPEGNETGGRPVPEGSDKPSVLTYSPLNNNAATAKTTQLTKPEKGYLELNEEGGQGKMEEERQDMKDDPDEQGERDLQEVIERDPENGGEEVDELESDEPIDITKPFKNNECSKKQLETLTVECFVAEGKKIIKKINEMQMTLKDMPQNFNKACILRQLYQNARYGISRRFCKAFLDELLKDDLFACVANAMRRLQATWPKVFVESPNPEKEFNSGVTKLIPANYDPPENVVAAVWIKLNNTALGSTDLHEDSRVKAGEQNLLEYFLQEFLPAVSQGGYTGIKTARGAMTHSGISTVYNCSMSTANVSYFHKYNGVEKLMHFRNTPNERLNMTCLFALAYLTDENNNHLIMSKNETIDKIIFYLQNACKMKARRFRGLSSFELANALARIAVNDENKKMIGRRNGIVELMNMFNGAKSEEGKTAAANALWMLLFDSENQQIFKNIDGAVDNMMAMEASQATDSRFRMKLLVTGYAISEEICHQGCENAKLRKAVTGIIWEVKTKHEHMEKRAESVQDVRETKANSGKHLMISYNWDQQPLMLKIRDALTQEGYNVWMDVDKIGGSTLQAMAFAVENSAVILIGVSRKYKESANCRSEAEYAFQLRKDIVPIMLEKNYQPDGWLGFIVGAKFWIDFVSKMDLEENVIKLTREIGERGKISSELIKAVDAVDLGAAPVPQTKSRVDEISKWSNADVRNWVKETCLSDKPMNASILDKLTGKRLLSLYQLYKESPDFFFNSIRADFGFADILDLLDFTDSLKELLT